jgi:hypothetical protein
MIDKGLTYAYAEGGPVASEGRPRPNPFVRPMPNGKPVYDYITVDGFVGGPAVLPPAAAPVGDLFPQQPVFGRRDHLGMPVFDRRDHLDGPDRNQRHPQQPVFGRRDHLGMPVFDRRDHLDGPDRNQRHPRPILYFGPDGQPVYGGIFPQPPVEPVVPPEVMPIEPGGDFGLPPPVQPVVPPPPLGRIPLGRMEPIIDYFDENGKRVFIGIDGRFPDQPVVPPPVQPVVPPPVTGPDGTSRTYSPPIFSRPSAADTRAAGYDAAIQRFANSPFVRPEGIMGLQRGKLRLS